MWEEKNIVCTIDKCCKKIRFTSDNEQSDVQKVKNALLQKAEKDEVLKALLSGNLIVLQQLDTDINCYCDIEEDERIPNKAKINVVLIKEPSEVKVVPWDNNLLMIDNDLPNPVPSPNTEQNDYAYSVQQSDPVLVPNISSLVNENKMALENPSKKNQKRKVYYGLYKYFII